MFDLDGTISDPEVGITRSVQYALESFGIHEPDMTKLRPFIGPPLRDSFMEFYGFTQEQAEQAVAKYRERFSVVGKYENELYPGMKELLRDLQAAGAHLAIASSKPTVFVEDILIHFGIRQYFEVVVGSELDGTRDRKEEVVGEALRRFGAADLSSVVLIGDRKYDVIGAKAAGVHQIGVGYGYAVPGELQEAGAEIIVQDVEGLRGVLLGYRFGNEAAGQTASGAEGTDPSPEKTDAQPEKTDARPEKVDYYSRYRQPGGRYGGAYYGKSAGQTGGGAYGNSQPYTTSKASRFFAATGNCALAMLLYFIINLVVTVVLMFVGMMVTPFGALRYNEAQDIWLDIGGAAGVLIAFIVCFAIWHKQIRIRPARPVDGLSLLPLVILAAALSLGMNGLLNLVELYKYSPTFQEVSEYQTDMPIWLGILSFGILAPLGEETVFRGVVYGQLKKISNAPVAVVLSALIFGLYHGNLVQFVYAALLGIVMALIYEIYDSLLASILFHAVANLTVYVLLDLTPVGEVFVLPVSSAVFLLLSLVSLVLMVKWQKQR